MSSTTISLISNLTLLSSDFFYLKMHQLQIYSFSNFFNQSFFIFNFQLHTSISNFYFKFLTLNFTFNFHCFQISSTSEFINFKCLQFQISSTRKFFIFKFQFHTSISNFNFKFLQFQNSSTNVTLKLHTSIAFSIYNFKPQLWLSLAQLSPSLFL